MRVLRFLLPVMLLTGLTATSSLYAQFDDVYYDPAKDNLSDTYARVEKYDNNSTNTTSSGGYEGNNYVNNSYDNGYDDESYDYQDGYDSGYEDGYYTSRINKFHRYNGGFNNYYDNFGYNNGWMFRPSMTFGYDPFFNYNRYYNNSFWGFGSPYDSYYGGYGNYGYGGYGNNYGYGGL